MTSLPELQYSKPLLLKEVFSVISCSRKLNNLIHENATMPRCGSDLYLPHR